MNKNFKFSIIIPTISNNNYLQKNLSFLNKQSFRNFEVIIVTENIFKAKKYNFNLKIFFTKISMPGEKRNFGAKIAKGKYLIFIDDDCYPHKEWLNIANNFLKKNKSDNYIIGGPGILPHNETFLSKTINLFFISLFLGNSRARYLNIKKYNLMNFDDWPSVNLIISKNNFFKIGGYDKKYWPGEDSKLCLKFQLQGGKIIYLSKFIVFHFRRSNIIKYTKQIFRYSYTRAFFFKNFDKNSFKIIYTLPSICLLYFIFLLTSMKINYFDIAIIFICFFSLLIDMFSSFKYEKNLKILFFSRFLILYSLIIYGSGFIYGFFVYKYKNSLGR